LLVIGGGLDSQVRSALASRFHSWQLFRMARTIILYALALAAAVAALQWLEYRYLSRLFSTEIYVALIAAAFAALGMWAGLRLTARLRSGDFKPNRPFGR